MKYEVQVKVDDVWRLAHGTRFSAFASQRSESLSGKYTEVRIVKNRWVRKPLIVEYTNTQIVANDNG